MYQLKKKNNMQRQGLFPVCNLHVVMARTILEIHKKKQVLKQT